MASFDKRGELPCLAPARLSKLSRHQRRVRQRAATESDIDPFLNQIDGPIIQHHVNLEFGVLLEKTIKLTHDVKAPEANRCGDAQLAAQCGACATRCQNSLFSLLDRAFCPDIETHPR